MFFSSAFYNQHRDNSLQIGRRNRDSKRSIAINLIVITMYDDL